MAKKTAKPRKKTLVRRSGAPRAKKTTRPRKSMLLAATTNNICIGVPQHNESVATTFTARGSVRPRNATLTMAKATQTDDTTKFFNGANIVVSSTTGHWTFDLSGLSAGKTYALAVMSSSGAIDNLVFTT